MHLCLSKIATKEKLIDEANISLNKEIKMFYQV